MSDEEIPAEPKPPAVEVARPDIAKPPTDSLGRSMANKRGRKPGPQGPRNASSGNAGNANVSPMARELGKRLPADISAMSDEKIGEAIAGAYAAIGLAAGPHWRLFAQEKARMGEVFGPIARVFGTEELAKYLLVAVAFPTVAEITAPRMAIQSMIRKGDIDKEEGRSVLLRIKGMQAAEAKLSFDQDTAEGEAFLNAEIKAGRDTAADMKRAEMERDLGIESPKPTN